MDDVVWASKRRGRGRAGSARRRRHCRRYGQHLAGNTGGRRQQRHRVSDVHRKPEPGAGHRCRYTPGGQLQAIFDADAAAGAGASTENDFWFDEMLARMGTAGSFDDNNQWLFTRGRAAFMKEHSPGILGFGGQLAYWESIDGRGGYTITAQVGAANVSLTEDTTLRKQTPSYWRSVHRNAGAGSRSCRPSSSPTPTCS